MQTVTSGRIQTHFGAVVDIAKAGEPVTITQYGRPALMLFSYSEGEALLKSRARQDIAQWFKDRSAWVAQEAADLTADQVNEMVHALRA